MLRRAVFLLFCAFIGQTGVHFISQLQDIFAEGAGIGRIVGGGYKK